jgi:5-formyltetrahydrofolate cyclo-ligase
MLETKTEWRRALLAARGAIPSDVRRRDSTVIADTVSRLRCFGRARAILGYCAIGAEVDPSDALARPGIPPVPRYRPLVADGPPRWLEWQETPTGEGVGADIAAAALVYPVLILVPGVGFDSRGVRLGRGAGFYDRALAELRSCGTVYAVGLAFECQIAASLPTDPWDQRVDCIVTELRVIGGRDGAITAADEGRL